jgi:hypothetical protein
MRFVIALCLFIVTSRCEYFSSMTSSSFSSSYSNINGEEHSSSTARENYYEKDSTGVDRSGGGELRSQDGIQIFEKTQSCDGGKCVSNSDSRKRRFPANGRHRMNSLLVA